MQPLVECVPNISEGRDAERIERIVAAARSVEGVSVLDVDPGKETNRTVITFVGTPDAVLEGAFRLIQRASELIDMSKHKGAHPRHGATDVCPFVPVAGVTMEQCSELARRLGARVGSELQIPVYLYEHAATRPERRSLAYLRQGEYEALPTKLAQEQWRPDFGPARFVPRSGVVTIGAREFLIAYNVNLNSRVKEHATDLAFDLREKGRAVRRGQTDAWYTSGTLLKYEPSKQRFPSAYDDFVGKSLDELERHYREVLGLELREELAFHELDPNDLEGKSVHRRGRFKACRAVGWLIPEYGRAQISINLTDYKTTSMHDVLEASRDMARERGAVVTGSEIVGLVPYDALRRAADFYLARQGSSRGIPVCDLVETAVQSLGLKDVGKFDPQKSILGLPTTDGPLVSKRLNDFADEVSRATPAPGGGSIAALVGSLGASLAAMVANLTHAKSAHRAAHAELEEVAVRAQQLKDALLRAVDLDTQAFDAVMEAMRLPKATPTESAARDVAIEAGTKRATQVPLHTAELCLEALDLCRRAAEKGLPASVTDAGVGALVARAGFEGAVYNVRVNLKSIKDAAWVEQVRGQVKAMGERATALAAATSAKVEALL
ncbi:MAG: glutamate formimidoyltransferase [Planctomycetes bacterium]|nr:glutamate formimidoyltransferase [Planctomycetota bacterium]